MATKKKTPANKKRPAVKAKPKPKAPTVSVRPKKKKPERWEHPASDAVRMLTAKQSFGGHMLKAVDVLRIPQAHADPSDEIIKITSILIAAGAYPSVALRAIGVPENLARTWIERGMMDPGSACGKFLRAIDAAEARAEIMDTALISMGVKHWPALAWIRERRSAKRWAAKYVVDDAELRPTQQPVAAAPDYDQLSHVLAILQDAGALGNPASETVIDVPKSNGSPNGSTERDRSKTTS